MNAFEAALNASAADPASEARLSNVLNVPRNHHHQHSRGGWFDLGSIHTLLRKNELKKCQTLDFHTTEVFSFLFISSHIIPFLSEDRDGLFHNLVTWMTEQ